MVDRLERRRFLGGGPLYNPQPKVPTSFTKPTVHFPFLSLGNFVFCFVLLVVDLGIFATHPDSPAPFSLRNYSLARRPMMGRVKLKIKRLESTSNRQVTYSKRRNGILKKARELSILCDIEIILLMFSPTGRPTLFHGARSNIEEVIAKFAQLTPQERAKRKLESLEVCSSHNLSFQIRFLFILFFMHQALKKTFKKLDHDVNLQDFLGASYWSNPDKVDSTEHLRQMEDSLRESLNRIRVHKENFGKHQLMSLECASQFQNGMHLPLIMDGVQEAQPLSWLPNNENQHLILPEEPSYLPQRDMECSADASIPGYSGYYSTGKQTEIGNSGQVDEQGQEGSALNQLSGNSNLRLQLSEQYLYSPFGNMNLPDEKKLKPEMEMNLQGNPVDYQVNGNFEIPAPIYDNRQHTWVSASGPCSIAMFDENSFSQGNVPPIVHSAFPDSLLAYINHHNYVSIFAYAAIIPD
uniref:MADS-box domain-containing protein n=1 Tax=Vitis vinifera TaxID=29760 RepID=A5AEH9_VITVI|nr:hypothetical protein VITISV_038034 [Vitis vinifera]